VGAQRRRSIEARPRSARSWLPALITGGYLSLDQILDSELQTHSDLVAVIAARPAQKVVEWHACRAMGVLRLRAEGRWHGGRISPSYWSDRVQLFPPMYGT